MCIPLVAYGVISVVLAAAASGVSAYGSYQEGKTQDKYYKYLADQNDREAEALQQTAEQQTTIAQNEAAQKSKELKGEVSTVKGAQAAAMAAMGIYGVTAQDVLNDTTNKAKLDEANIRYNADIQSWAARKEASDRGWALRNLSTLYRFAGKQARKAANLNMTSSLLGLASSLTILAGKGGGSKTEIQGGSGGKIIQTQNYGTTWSPYKR